MARRSTWTMQDAKRHFSALLTAAQRTPQTVTENGKPAVVVIAADEYERLRRLKFPTFVELLLAMPRDDGEFERLRVRFRDIEF